jgi:hypothetical protein
MLAYAAAPENRARLEPRNRLLAALPPEDLWRRRPHLEPVTLPRRKVLFEPDERLTRIYLIETAVVSLVSLRGSGPRSRWRAWAGRLGRGRGHCCAATARSAATGVIWRHVQVSGDDVSHK